MSTYFIDLGWILNKSNLQWNLSLKRSETQLSRTVVSGKDHIFKRKQDIMVSHFSMNEGKKIIHFPLFVSKYVIQMFLIFQ